MGGPAAAMALASCSTCRPTPTSGGPRHRSPATPIDYATTLLEEQFGKPFTWETSAGEAWTSGGDAFLACMAENGRDMADQGLED